MTAPGWRERGEPASRGQTETIGVVLILSMTIIGATVALAFGATALNDARIDSQEGGIEHALTQLDSRAAMVGLGDSATQRVPLSASGVGGYHVDPDAGWINVTHHGYSASNDQVLYNETLGAVVYQRDDTRIAYQGGGVWAASDNGSRMVSPPEFHYRSATLTLPVIQVAGGSAVAGAAVTAEVTQVESARPVYPNLTRTYPVTGDTFANPIREGNVTVTVKSAFYEAWADYFRTRTAGNVTVDHAATTASVKLISLGTVGAFDMPADGNSIEIRGLGQGHPITNFTITLYPDDTDAADFSNLQWSLYGDKGNQEFELHLRKGGNGADLPETGDCTERYVKATVYYSNSSGNPYHGWHDDQAFTTSCDDLDGDGANETYLRANLTGSSILSMQSLSDSDVNHFSPSGNTDLTTIDFDQHAGDPGAGWEPKTFDAADDDTTIGNLTNHYLSLMGPDIELTVEDKGSDTVNEDASTGTLEQTGGGGSFITFLHITENRVTIELD